MIDKLYSPCRLCPKLCGTDRLSGSLGFCGTGTGISMASAVLHRGEEPPISGEKGSGTIFFTGCTLQCGYCQNWQLSHAASYMGVTVSTDEFVMICLELQKRGAENINLVTGTHQIPAIIQGISMAEEQGLSIPIVWNSSGYERTEILEHINPFIDIYLIDIKTLDRRIAARYCGSPSYVDAVTGVIPWIVEQKPIQYERNRLLQGVIIRHLLVPGEMDATWEVLAWFAEKFKDHALLSVMLQFINPWDRTAPAGDMETSVIKALEEYAIEDGFIQEVTQDDAWLPDFSQVNPFPQEYSSPVWHWKSGFLGS